MKEYIDVSNKEREPEVCPKCGKERQKWQSYCKEHYNEYQKLRRKSDPDAKKKNTEYMREYRARIKNG